ncbi:MAG: sel1 repeat family protein [Alkalinema sp. RU_4_3]|nr:sel1 repeat family protein [Alkalinema sp. RU_4_3]
MVGLAENGHRTSQEIAGNCYQLGLGTDVDYPKAAQWYECAIALGSGLAANNLAGMVQRGWDENPPNPERAKALFEQARALGFEHSPKLA